MRVRKLFFEALEQRQLLSVCCFPHPVSIPLTSSGIGSAAGTIVAVHGGSTVGAYTFKAPLTGTMVIRETSGPPGVNAFPTLLTVYNAIGNPIPSLYNVPAQPYTNQYEISVTKNSVYYAGVATQNNTTGSFSIQITSYQDPLLCALVYQLFAQHRQINRNDMIQILYSTVTNSTSTLSTADFADLQTIVNQGATAFNMLNYVQVLAGDVVNVNGANTYWTGGQTTTTLLGDLRAGSSAGQMDKLVGKWFLGTDLPVPNVVPNFVTKANKEKVFIPSYLYAPVQGCLYGVNGVGSDNGTPQLTDAHQGLLGDCYLIAGLTSIAKANPAAISNMIFPNGDGTWTVRFYSNSTVNGTTTSVPSYVTVNNQLPVLPKGMPEEFSKDGLAYDGYNTITNVNSLTNVLWLPLLEKAYAQWSELGYEEQGKNPPINSYVAIGGGGYEVRVFDQALGEASDGSQQVNAGTPAFSSTTLIQKIRTSGEAVTIGTKEGTPAKNLIGGHAYIVESYTANGGIFTLYNPHGSDQPDDLTWGDLDTYCDEFTYADTSKTQAFSSSVPVSTTSVNTSQPPANPTDTCATTGGAGAANSAAPSEWFVMSNWEANSKKALPQPATHDLALLAYQA